MKNIVKTLALLAIATTFASCSAMNLDNETPEFTGCRKTKGGAANIVVIKGFMHLMDYAEYTIQEIVVNKAYTVVEFRDEAAGHTITAHLRNDSKDEAGNFSNGTLTLEYDNSYGLRSRFDPDYQVTSATILENGHVVISGYDKNGSSSTFGEEFMIF